MGHSFSEYRLLLTLEKTCIVIERYAYDYQLKESRIKGLL